MKRNTFDLSHLSYQVGKIGKLNTNSLIPIVGGDSITMNADIVVRLQPPRRDIVSDLKVDTFAFYVPHRHIYGDKWTQFIKEGAKETVTFPSYTPSENLNFMGPILYNSVAAPLWIPAGYSRIYNRYFRIPTDKSNILKDNYQHNTGPYSDANYGYSCARLKDFWTTGNFNDYDPNSAKVSIAANKLDIIDYEQIKSTYKNELDRDWFTTRYNDILKGTWGAGVNIDADERPQLVARQSSWISGKDIDGTAGDNLGTFSGKMIGRVNLRIPRKYFPEHGALWIMTLARYPSIHESSIHYLTTRSNPSYAELAGDYDIVLKQRPVKHPVSDFMYNIPSGHGFANLGTHPYGQWYRSHPSVVHNRYRELDGFPFITDKPQNLTNAAYVQPGDYDTTFKTNQLGDWRTMTNFTMSVKRTIPTAREQIYSGVR